MCLVEGKYRIIQGGSESAAARRYATFMHMVFTPHLSLAASSPSHVGKGLLPGDICLDSLRIILAVTMVPTGAPLSSSLQKNAHIGRPNILNNSWCKKGRTWAKSMEHRFGPFQVRW